MSDRVTRSGDEKADRQAWMRRAARTMAEVLISAIEDPNDDEDDASDADREAP